MPSFKNWWGRGYYARPERTLLHILFWLAYLSFLSFTAFEHLRTGSDKSLSFGMLAWLVPIYLVWVYYIFITTSYAFFQRRQMGKALIMAFVSLLIYANSDIVYSYLLASKLSEEGVSSRLPQADGFASFYRHSLLSWFAIFHVLFGFVLYLGLPVLCKFFRDLQRSYQQFNELKERNMQLELNLIKSQANPHFLLNTLNNIYGLTINGTRQQIGEMIINLSEVLKYSLYECNSEFVALSKEIRLIQSYIDLEEVRSDFIDVSFDVQTDRREYSIPPFLLFPLVENAFKHGAKDLVATTHIAMQLSVTDDRLTFRIENDLQPVSAGTGGLGLSALKKKTEYYYPNNSTLSAIVRGNRYIAELQIAGLCQR